MRVLKARSKNYFIEYDHGAVEIYWNPSFEKWMVLFHFLPIRGCCESSPLELLTMIGLTIEDIRSLSALCHFKWYMLPIDLSKAITTAHEVVG